MYSLTTNQERYLFAEMSGTYSFFIGVWYEISGRLDPGRLKAAINASLSRHTGCRTSFRRDAQGDYLAIVENEAKFEFYVLSVPDISPEAIKTAVAPYLKKLQRFDRLAGFHKFFLLDTGADRQAFVLCQHHAVSDGRSLDIVSTEIAQLYSAPEAALPTAVPFHDVAHDASVRPEDTVFWKNALEGIEDIPRFHKNLAEAVPNPGRIGWAPKAKAAQALRMVQPGLTFFSMLAAGFAAQIAVQTRQQDVVFSIQSAGRHGFSDAIVTGSFSNALPVRTYVDLDKPFAELAKRLQQRIREALKHERLGYHRIQQLTGVRPDFALNLYPAAPALHFGALTAGPRRFLTSESDYGVNLRWHHDALGNPGVDAYFDAALVEQDRIQAFLDRSVAICSAAAAAPHERVSRLLDANQIAPQALALVPSEEAPQRLFKLFSAQAANHAARPAIGFDGHLISYADLAARVEGRAACLYATGVAAGMTVGFLADRAPNFVIDMLALSRLGVAFAAFDTEYPLPRLIELFKVLQCDFIISSGAKPHPILEGLRDAGARTLDLTGMTAANHLSAPEPEAPDDNEIAYYLFTSGTTGTPKAIGVGHKALPHFLGWQAETFNVVPGDRVTLLSGLAHDPVLRDVFLPLLHGAELTIPSQDILRNPRELAIWLQQKKPSIVHTTPQMGQLLYDVTTGKPTLPNTRLIFWGGDMLPGTLVRQFSEANPSLEQVNFYGATETPQAALYYRHDNLLHPPLKILPVGKPVAGLLAEVISSRAQPLDINELGEVRIMTPYLVRIVGKLPTDSGTGQVYDTGDLGYRRPDGGIQLVGRQDDQVSIRGYRVELSDVERHLAQIEGVATACVLPEKDAQGRTFLFAHAVINRNDLSLDSQILRSRMQAAVPTYMVPTVILLHDRLPLLPNGKRNRAALRALQKSFQPEQAPSDEAMPAVEVSDFSAGERAVLGVFEKTTGLKVAHKHQNFVETGADSLNYIQAMLRLESIIPNLPADWQDMTVAELGRRVQIDADDRGAGWTRLFRPVQAEFPVLLRAIAILAIVALHLQVGSLGGGGTFILFMLMGYSIFRFQLPRFLSDGSIKGFLNPLVTVVIATEVVSLLMWAAKIMQGEPFNLAALLFVTNFLDFSADGTASGGIVWLWFIACYVQIMLLCAVFLALPPVRALLMANLPRAMTGIFLGATIVKFGLIGLVSPTMLTGGVPLLHPWNYMPTTHFSTVMLGGIIYLAASGVYSRTLCMALSVLYALAVGTVFSANSPFLFIAGVTLIIFARSMPMPFVLYWMLLQISSASLYIYLLHAPIFSFLRMGGLDIPPVGFLILIVSGIVGFGLYLRTRRHPAKG